MKKVLLINPWAVNNDGYYARGFLHGVCKKAKITFVTNYYFEDANNEKEVNIKRFFFRRSENMKRGLKRRVVRSYEYIYAYLKILRLLKKDKFDIIHIHWFLFYPIDIQFIKQMKKYTKRIVLTAHNVLPHCNGEKSIEYLRKIYSMVDVILVHGEAIKSEFKHFFPEYINKVKIQYHGTYFNQKVAFKENKIDLALAEKINKHKADKVFVMLGAQFYNKGTDRLIKAWNNLKSITQNSLLVIAGAKNGTYSELDDLCDIIKKTENIIYIDSFVDNNVANFLFNKADCVVIPYRHASMSGVVFTASEFSKTVICTETGALPEYLENDVDSFICVNSDKALEDCLKKVICGYNKENLKEMGIALNKNICRKFSWDKIGDVVVKEVYTRGSI